MNIGQKLRQLRKDAKVTLVELAGKTGIDQATLSRIETGKMTGTVKSHIKICEALGASLPDLYAGLDPRDHTVHKQSKTSSSEVYVHTSGRSNIQMLTPDVLKKKMMPVMISIDPDGSTPREQASVGTEKFVFVLDGRVEAVIDQQKHIIKKGDTLYFDASLPHKLTNIGKKQARCIAISTPPAL